MDSLFYIFLGYCISSLFFLHLSDKPKLFYYSQKVQKDTYEVPVDFYEEKKLKKPLSIQKISTQNIKPSLISGIEKETKVLDQLFKELKESGTSSKSQLIADEINNIWEIQGGATEALLLKRGIKAFKKGAYKLSRQMFFHILTIDQKNSEAWYWQARVFIKEGKFKDTIFSLNKAIEINHRHYPSYFLLGSVMEQLNEPEIAFKLYNLVLEIYPKHEESLQRHKSLQASILGRAQ